MASTALWYRILRPTRRGFSSRQAIMLGTPTESPGGEPGLLISHSDPENTAAGDRAITGRQV